ncbi:phenylalanine--tRNA ligase beta subunit [Ligilactobacillus hayakitensis DSM 18933 = JCM 14209]|uniref:Phenylalanine--tRNA ligase beta subunit n=1 Tax=Ligilactobacillus hayakitensis DSM 18933 = JCM 14209 TaxID=1423755 RepID=A0A0R1WPT1_9LACO|nr:DUF4479 and tRNA-binding domain-containing protein [Ligilactobacillus hayakitensis]KRM19429.1 phenylalanine--tRNA ligase beta subunit [Ligilactobacillus hayakitensis DSM 18933 = JCM 14209]
MLVSTYNSKNIGDVLILMLNADSENQESQSKNNVTRIYDVKTNKTLGFNIFEASTVVPNLKGNGQVVLNNQQVNALNELLEQNGFEPELVVDESPKFVVGRVEEMVEHPDSDHLHVTKVRVDNDEVLQIVCGAPNVDQGQKVVVAKVGAMMPSGLIIWPGALRGETSNGMICAARELALPNAPQKRGILVLDENDTDFNVGEEFNFEKGAQLFVNK